MKKLTNKEREIMDLYWQHGKSWIFTGNMGLCSYASCRNTMLTRSPISTPFPPKKNEVYLFRMDSSG